MEAAAAATAAEFREKQDADEEESGEKGVAEDAAAAAAAGTAKAAFDELACQCCGWDGDDDRMVLCEGCPHGYHIYCLKPPMEQIPAGDWYCPVCAEGPLRGPAEAAVKAAVADGDKVEKAWLRTLVVGSEVDADDPTVGEWFCAKVVDVRSLSAAAVAASAGPVSPGSPENKQGPRSSLQPKELEAEGPQTAGTC